MEDDEKENENFNKSMRLTGNSLELLNSNGYNPNLVDQMIIE